MLLGVMRSKEALEMDGRGLRAQLGERDAALALAEEARAAAVRVNGELKGQFDALVEEQVRNTQALSKENNLLKQQLKKWVCRGLPFPLAVGWVGHLVFVSRQTQP